METNEKQLEKEKKEKYARENAQVQKEADEERAANEKKKKDAAEKAENDKKAAA